MTIIEAPRRENTIVATITVGMALVGWVAWLVLRRNDAPAVAECVTAAEAATAALTIPPVVTLAAILLIPVAYVAGQVARGIGHTRTIGRGHLHAIKGKVLAACLLVAALVILSGGLR